MPAEIEYAQPEVGSSLRVATMGKRERLFLWLVLILAASLVLAVLSWLADELGVGRRRVDRAAGRRFDRGAHHHAGKHGLACDHRPERVPQPLDPAGRHVAASLSPGAAVKKLYGSCRVNSVQDAMRESGATCR